MNRRYERGNITEIVLIAVLVLAVAGLIIWRVLDSNKQSQQEKQTAVSPVQTTTGKEEPTNTRVSTPASDPNKGYIVIEDWGVRFKPTGSEQIKYAKVSASRGDGYDFTTETAQKVEGCSDAALWLVDRKKTKDEVLNGLILNNGNKIGDFYYYYYHTQEMCARSTTGQAVIEQQIKALETLIKTIEAKQ